MKAYLLDTYNRYKRYSETLDVKTHFCNKTWVVFNDGGERELYKFKEDGTIRIILSGRVSSGTWEYDPTDKSMIITASGQSIMVHPGMYEKILIGLQVDGTNECAFLIEENNSQEFAPKTKTELIEYFELIEKNRIEEEEKQIELQLQEEARREEEERAQKEANELKKKAQEMENKIFRQLIPSVRKEKIRLKQSIRRKQIFAILFNVFIFILGVALFGAFCLGFPILEMKLSIFQYLLSNRFTGSVLWLLHVGLGCLCLSGVKYYYRSVPCLNETAVDKVFIASNYQLDDQTYKRIRERLLKAL